MGEAARVAARPDRSRAEVGTVDRQCALFPEGDLDIAGAAALERPWRAVIDLYQPDVLVIDLADVSFLDCSGVGLLVRTHKRQRAHGGRVEVRNPDGLALKVLEMTGVDTLLQVTVGAE